MKTNHAKAVVFIGLGLLGTGCSTLDATSHITPDSPYYFTGTRLNIAAIRQDQATLARFAEYSMMPAEYPILDLPFSLVMDSVWFAAPALLSNDPAFWMARR